jgi:hypothetical protein
LGGDSLPTAYLSVSASDCVVEFHAYFLCIWMIEGISHRLFLLMFLHYSSWKRRKIISESVAAASGKLSIVATKWKMGDIGSPFLFSSVPNSECWIGVEAG